MIVFDTYRKCHFCGYSGYMDRWLTNSVYPLVISFVLLLLGLIPGILFIAWSWRKLMCPNCGKIRN